MKKVKLAIFGLFLVATAGCKKVENSLNDKPKELTVSSFAGSGAVGYLDATGTTAVFNSLKGIAMDPIGNMYVTDYFNHKIRKITPEGVVTTIAGSTAGYADGTGTAAQFFFPIGIVSDASGNLYVTDNGNARIRKITPAGVVSTYAGSGNEGFQDGPALTAQFLNIRYLAIDASNNLYVADNGNHRIRKISTSGQVTTVAGTGVYGVVDGPVATASIGEPMGITIDPAGNIYVSHLGEYGYLRKITPNGQVIRITGINLPGAYLDGIAGLARVNEPGNLRSDADGNIYIADSANGLIRKYDPKANIISTYAGSYNYIVDGNGRQRPTGLFKDGPSNQALFSNPLDFIFDTHGNMFVADQANSIVRKVSSVDLPLSQSDLDKKNWNKPTNWK